MKKVFEVDGMTCNSCTRLIEDGLGKMKGVDKVSASFVKNKVEVEFHSGLVSEKKIVDKIKELGYGVGGRGSVVGSRKGTPLDSLRHQTGQGGKSMGDRIGFWFMIGSLLVLAYFVYGWVSKLDISIPAVGESSGIIILFFVGLLTGFHCISMCGGFVVGYTTKNAEKGYKGFRQHFVYGGAKVFSYALISVAYLIF